MKRLLSATALIIFLTGVPLAQGMKKQPPPDVYGRVIINNYSTKAGRAPVVFDHWLNRSRLSALPRGPRFCHGTGRHADKSL
jgi:hypothetical protein